MKKYFKTAGIVLILAGLISVQCNCTKKSTTSSGGGTGGGGGTPTPDNSDVAMWVTKADQSILLQKQASLLALSSGSGSPATITLDSTQIFQTVDGFGYTLTGGSASLINALSATEKNNLLNELFGSAANSIGVSYLRVSLGASDLSASVFSYDDMPTGQTDINLTNFSLSKDTVDVIPILKQILVINPNIKILASPWSAPVWMKDNGNSMGGGLQTQYYNVYAQYFVKYIQAMQAKGITIDAVTIQNEPQHGGNNPSMVMSALEEAAFVKTALGPKLQAAGLSTKIIVWDHNCDNPTYPITVLNDAAAKPFINGSAFHLYAGDISALSAVHSAHPDKNLYFTEQWTGSTGTFNGDFLWHVKNVVIGSMINWSKNALEWNLANDGGFNPHTPGGCTQCKGAITLDGTINRNVGYYIIAQASKFVPAGSVRIASSTTSGLSNVAFKTPAGKTVVLVLNDTSTPQVVTIKSNTRSIVSALPAGAAATYVW
ncbi:glycoside hydrolase family 30 protein [Ferruginibacter sp. SUN106]|uniref:glycoside hydrolase family 30 protein n=1 Tax=Ferruginibacter sp. SUN106 TaxID=2978348 RepID=UPI003D3641CA